jgi:hypothetical protein
MRSARVGKCGLDGRQGPGKDPLRSAGCHIGAAMRDTTAAHTTQHASMLASTCRMSRGGLWVSGCKSNHAPALLLQSRTTVTHDQAMLLLLLLLLAVVPHLHHAGDGVLLGGEGVGGLAVGGVQVQHIHRQPRQHSVLLQAGLPPSNTQSRRC